MILQEALITIQETKTHDQAWLNRWLNPGIYILYDGEEVVYVGQALRGLDRIIQHVKEQKKIFTSFKIIDCQEDQLNKVEAELISHFVPKYNGNLPKNSKWVPVSVAKAITKEACVGKRNQQLLNNILKHNPWIPKLTLNSCAYVGMVYYQVLNLVLEKNTGYVIKDYLVDEIKGEV